MKLPAHLMVDREGNLFDTRKKDWSSLLPLRQNYQHSFRRIETVAQLKAILRVPYAWPGGYEIVILLQDGEWLCNTCARAEFRQLLWDIRNNCNTGWKPYGTECIANLDGPCPCSHCGRELSPYV